MPDIDVNPAALSRADSQPNGLNTPAGTSKSLTLNTPVSKGGKPVQSAPRVDVEQIYTSLKAAIGEHWTTYKDSVSKFILGALSQHELNRLISPFLLTPLPQKPGADPPPSVSDLLHLHNRILSTIHSNALRDAPDAPVAPWVSANDKPAATSKQLTGDAYDQRLRSEVMNLPPRTRHRLKNIQDEPSNPVTGDLQRLAQAKRPNTSTGAAAPSSGSGEMGTASLNQDAEIRKRYTLPLAQEIQDLPAASSIQERLIPICYEEGLSSGASHPGSTAEVLAMAVEMMLKSQLAVFLSRSRVNAPVSRPAVVPGEHVPKDSEVNTSNLGVAADLGISTATFKSQLAVEEAAALRGEIKRTEMGLLPCEVAATRAQGGGRGLPGDLRINWELGNPALGNLMPWLGERLVAGELDRDMYGTDTDSGFWERDGDGDVKMDDPDGDGDAMDVDAPSWEGGARGDRDALGSLLDDCLAVGL